MRCSAWPALRGIWENAARVMFRVPLLPRLDNPHLPSMLVALVGPACSGKFEVARYLIVHHHFRPAFLADSASLHQHAAELLPLCQNSSDHAPEPHEFASTVALLDYSTAHWRDNIVTLDLRSRGHIDVGFDKRPFFLLLGVDAPVTVRWRREMKRCEEPQGLSLRSKSGERCADSRYPSPDRRPLDELPLSLEDFVAADDEQLYGLSMDRPPPLSQDLPLTPSSSRSTTSSSLPSTAPASSSTFQIVLPSGMLVSRAQTSTLRSLLESAAMTIQNPYLTLSSLHTHLSSLSLPSTHRLRPSWDTYFLSLCTLASLRSNCMKRRVGAVLIRNNRVLSTGYNGTPRGLKNCADGGCSRCNGGAAGGTALDECLCLHAEENALLECGRERGGAEGTVLYCNT